MSTDLLDLSDRILAGAADIEDHHPFSPSNELAEVGEGTAFVQSFANVSALRTGDGLVLVDTGSPFAAGTIHAAVRAWDRSRLHTAVYTHGHIDHVFGTAPFEEEAAAGGDPAVTVVAHEDVDARFDRYCTCAGYNAVINQRQFQAPGLRWPTEYRRPDTTYRERMDLAVGGLDLQLHHARGETDDATWVWVPERRTVCTGDLVIWCTPNAGNPQKVQRYAADWAVALRAMAALGPELLLPGHGLPVRGADQVRAVLLDTAEVLEVLHDRTLALMNEGARLDDIVHEVRAPDELLAKPYLRPVYDDPEFVVRGVWRLYGGWYDGNPAHLKPAPDAALAAELAALAGGPAALADRALALVAAGGDADLRLAGHLAELAAQAAPEDPGVHRARAEVFGARAGAEPSLMAKGVFRWAEGESRRRAEGAPEPA
ncbi:MAG TPA: alkyl sulfatase dimerization domain-containing protein [Acidimicrobiales bacterium]|nr:alkyl sulfatase dimerization domain-containing protein [Acidimicrobiales bacterium]